MNEWIAKNWRADFSCPVCRSTQWTIIEHKLEFRPFVGGGLVMGGPTYPHVAIMSVPCGYTVFINALVAGVLDPVSPAGDDKQPA
jgi:hypothetical protein